MAVQNLAVKILTEMGHRSDEGGPEATEMGDTLKKVVGQILHVEKAVWLRVMRTLFSYALDEAALEDIWKDWDKHLQNTKGKKDLKPARLKELRAERKRLWQQV